MTNPAGSAPVWSLRSEPSHGAGPGDCTVRLAAAIGARYVTNPTCQKLSQRALEMTQLSATLLRSHLLSLQTIAHPFSLPAPSRSCYRDFRSLECSRCLRSLVCSRDLRSLICCGASRLFGHSLAHIFAWQLFVKFHLVCEQVLWTRSGGKEGGFGKSGRDVEMSVADRTET